MSIRIGHGYRVHVDDIDGFLVAAEAVLAPVRDDLDAALFAQEAADIYDSALRARRDYDHPSLREDALARFMARVTDAECGTVFHHPHSLDLDYAKPDTPDGQAGPWYVLLHCQRDAYHDAFRTLPDVEPYEYWNHTDTLPDGVTEDAWEQRKADWRWLTSARSIADVMSRWTHRDDPAPDKAYVTDPDVFTAHLPTREARATEIARDLTVAAMLASIANPQWEDVHDAMFDAERRARSAALIPLIARQLPTLDASDLDRGQPDSIVFDLPALT